MKKYIQYLITVLFSLVVFGLTAQQRFTKQWEKSYGDSRIKTIHDVIVNTAGEPVFVGILESNRALNKEIIWAIADTNGNLLDGVLLGNKQDDVPNAIIQSTDGGYLLAGTTVSNDSKDGWLIKVSNRGRAEWDKIYGGNGIDVFHDIVIDNQGNILVTGEKNGELFLVKLSLDGQLIWEKAFPFAGKATGTSIKVHPKEGYIINGFEVLNNDHQLLLLHINQDGELVWQKTISEAKGTDLCISPNGQILATGISFDKRKRTNVLLVCYNQQGQELWKKEYGGAGMDEANAIIALPDTTYFLTGSSTSHTRGARRNKGWLRKMDKEGKEIWQETQYFGGKGEDVALTLAATPEGNILVGGVTNSKTAGTEEGWLLSYKMEKKRIESIDFNNLELGEITFVDTDENKILAPLEKGFLNVSIANKTNKLINGIKLLLTAEKENIDFPNKYIVNQLPANTTTNVMIPIEGGVALKQGVHKLQIQLAGANDKAAESYSFKIQTQEKPKPNLIISKAAFSSEMAIPQQEMKLVLAVTNTGNKMAEVVKARFSFPYKVTTKNDLMKALGNIASGETKEITYSFLPEKEFLEDSISIGCQILEQDRKYGTEKTLSIEVLRQASKPTNTKSEQKEFLEIVWLSPNPDEIGSTELNWEKERVITKVKAISDKMLTVNNFSIYNNGASIDNGAKSDIVKLSSVKKDSSNRFTYTFIHQIQLGKGENKIQVSVKNASGESATTPLIINHNPVKPNLHLLAVGVPDNRLQFTQKDAIDFANTFKNQADILFNKVFLKVLNEPEETTIQTLRNSIQDLENQYLVNQIQEKDVVMLFISSHGQAYEDQQATSFRIHASDFRSLYPRQYSLDYETDILSVLNRINCKKLLFIDACHSGSIAFMTNGVKSANPTADLATAVVNLTNAKPGLRTIVSCSAGELSYEDPTWQNGAFTKSILEAFNNQTTPQEDKQLIPDMDNDHTLTLTELYSFLQQRVPFLVKTVKGKSQHPFMPNQQRMEHLPILFLSN